MSRYFEEMSRLAARHGIKAEESADGLHMTMDGTPFCRVDEKGGVFYRDADVGTRVRRQAKNDMIKSAGIVWEYVSAMEAAPVLKADTLDEKFKLLQDYGGYVLAGKDRGKHGFEFVTWRWTWERTAVGTGHYWEDNFQDAKEDFAVRSGLVSTDRLYDKDQTRELYRLVSRHLDSNYSPEQEKALLEKVKLKMERAFPDFEGSYQLERLAADPRTGYTFVQGKQRTAYATGWFDDKSGMYLSCTQPDEFPEAKQFESPYDGLAKLCREKIHLRDYEQVRDYPLTFEELENAQSLAYQLNWDYGANTGFIVGEVAFVKAVSEADEWLLCKQDAGVWQALDHVSPCQILKHQGEDHFGLWVQAIQGCPASGYPEQMKAHDCPAVVRQEQIGLTDIDRQKLWDTVDNGRPPTYSWFVLLDMDTPQEQMEEHPSLEDAIRQYAGTESNHKRLGVTKDDAATVDLLVSKEGEQWYTDDEQHLDSFKEDPVVMAAVQALHQQLPPSPTPGMKMEGM